MPFKLFWIKFIYNFSSWMIKSWMRVYSDPTETVTVLSLQHTKGREPTHMTTHVTWSVNRSASPVDWFITSTRRDQLVDRVALSRCKPRPQRLIQPTDVATNPINARDVAERTWKCETLSPCHKPRWETSACGICTRAPCSITTCVRQTC